MLGIVSNRDLPALAVILACSVVERVRESRAARRIVAALALAGAAWVVGG